MITAMRILDVGKDGLDLSEYDFVRFSDGWRRFDVRLTENGIEIMADIGSPISIELSSSNHFRAKWPSK